MDRSGLWDLRTFCFSRLAMRRLGIDLVVEGLVVLEVCGMPRVEVM